MTQSTSQLLAPDGLRLFRRAWVPDGRPTLVVAVVHGYGEHGGRYGNVAGALTPLGAAVEVYDLRGHGRSEGPRGHVDRFARYIADTGAFLAAVGAEHEGVPLFVLGHSLGGLIAALYAEELGEGGTARVWSGGVRPAGPQVGPGGPQPVRRETASTAPTPAGLVLSSPFLALGVPVPGVKLAAARLLARVTPRRDIGNTLLAADLSHDEAVVAAYGGDPLNHHVATARWAVETLAAQRRALDGASRLRVPLLLVLGTVDRIAAPKTARMLYERAGAVDKTCREYAGFYHEVFNEAGKERPLADLAGWLRARLPLATPVSEPI